MTGAMLDVARAAYAEHRWADAHEGFSRAAADTELSVEDLAALADAAWWLGRTDESLEHSERLYRCFVQGERNPAAAQVAVEVGFLWLLRGEETVGSGWISRAARLLAELDECAVHGYLVYLDVVAAMGADDLEAAVDLARDMHRLAVTHEDATLGALALVCEGVATVKGGALSAGLRTIDEAMLSVRTGVVAPSWAGNLYCQVMALCFELLDLNRARAWTDATERWCDEHDNPAMFVGICRVHRAQLHELEGDLDAAERVARQACRDLAEANVEVVAAGHYQIGEVRRLRGDEAGARTAYATAARLGREPQPGLALLDLAGGRLGAARRALDAALVTTGPPLARVPLLVARCEVATASDDGGAAAAAVDELERIAARFDTPGLVAVAREAAGVAHLAAGEADRAVTLLRDARRRWQGLSARHRAARLRLRLAAALAALGLDEAAAQETTVAHAEFDALGLPRPVPVPARRTVGGLSPREEEVLVRVAAGDTNRQVATALVISERTVERHLSNIFVKLDVASRTEAARFAFSHGLLEAAAPEGG